MQSDGIVRASKIRNATAMKNDEESTPKRRSSTGKKIKPALSFEGKKYRDLIRQESNISKENLNGGGHCELYAGHKDIIISIDKF